MVCVARAMTVMRFVHSTHTYTCTRTHKQLHIRTHAHTHPGTLQSVLYRTPTSSEEELRLITRSSEEQLRLIRRSILSPHCTRCALSLLPLSPFRGQKTGLSLGAERVYELQRDKEKNRDAKGKKVSSYKKGARDQAGTGEHNLLESEVLISVDNVCY